MRNSATACLACVVMLAGLSCPPTGRSQTGPGAMHRVPLTELQGLWQQQGYARLIQVLADGVNLYDISSVHCLLVNTLDIDTVEQLVPDVLVNSDRSEFITDPEHVFYDTHGYRYRSLLQPPEVCINGITAPTADPLENFETLWHLFNENYAFFERRGVNWAEQYVENRDSVAELTASVADQRALFEILAGMIVSLDRDGHAGLAKTDPQTGEVLEQVFADDLRELGQRLEQAFSELYTPAQLSALYEAQDQFTSLDSFIAYLFELFVLELIEAHQSILDSYTVDAGMQTALDGQIRWGRMRENIGYLQVGSMENAALNSGADAYFDSLDDVMQHILQSFEDTAAVIVDVRLNQGGLDAVSLAIAAYFADVRRLVYRKDTRSADAYVNPIDMYLSPEPGAYTKPVYVLTSALTASAAEVFALTMRAFPHVTLIGEPSNGILSDALVKTLPNGWQVSLSNEIYTGADGISYEYIGIPPDHVSLMLDQNDLQAERDSAIEKVIELQASTGLASCEYRLRMHSGPFYWAEVKITNRSDRRISGWQVNWQQPHSASVLTFWNALVEYSDGVYSARNVFWNNSIYPGKSRRFYIFGLLRGELPPIQVYGDICI